LREKQDTQENKPGQENYQECPLTDMREHTPVSHGGIIKIPVTGVLILSFLKLLMSYQ